jgi:hypothetical protein
MGQSQRVCLKTFFFLQVKRYFHRTKAATRYHTPTVLELMKQLELWRETLDLQSKVAWQEFLV